MFKRYSTTTSVIAWLVIITMHFNSIFTAVEVLLEPSVVYAANWVCGQDLNGDGYVDAQGETGSCINTPQGHLCPIGAVDCVSTYTTPQCPPGGSLNPNTDKCEASPTISCQSGFNYDSSLDICVQPVTCPSGGVLNGITDLCEIVFSTALCPAGYTYNSTYAACIKDVTCPSGGIYQPSRDVCELSPTYNCPTGYTYNSSTGKCEVSPQCPSGFSYNATADRCVKSAILTCPSGYTYNTSTGKCERSPSCPPGGSYNSYYNRCQTAASPYYICSYNNRTYSTLSQCQSNCKQTATCNVSYQYYGEYGVWDNNCYTSPETSECIGTCVYGAPPVTSPPPGSVRIGIYATNTFYGCFNDYYYRVTSYTCPLGNYSCSGSPPSCSKSYSCSTGYNCPSGYYLSGSVCVASPSCPNGGTLNGATDKCEITPIFSCPSGSSYDSALKMCVTSASCGSGGVLNTGRDVCQITASINCPSGYNYNSSTGACETSPVCNIGVFDPTIDKCKVVASDLCPSGYTFNNTTGKCEIAPPCPSGALYSNTIDKCTVDAQHDCPVSYSYSSTSRMCEAQPLCPSGSYDPNTSSCYLGENTCPLGPQYVCMNNNGTMQCSANTCIDLDTTPPIVNTLDTRMLQNDGRRGPNGECLDQVYIFSGRPMRCRPRGLSVGYLNNCCQSSGSTISDNLGDANSVYKVYGAIKTIYQVGQVAYYSNLLGSGAATWTSMVSSGSTVTEVTIMTSSGTTTLTGNVAAAIGSGINSGAIGTAAGAQASVQAGLANFASAMLPGMLVSAVVFVAMKVLMGNGCDQEDLETDMLRDSKYCHYVGEYCEKKWPLIGCVQKAKSYCCFNSKLGRIIHEQGRPQLKSFTSYPGGVWGDPDSPNCRGFTPEEFQMIDFSRIDFSEYVQDVQKDMSTKIQNAQQKINQKITNFYNSIR